MKKYLVAGAAVLIMAFGATDIASAKSHGSSSGSGQQGQSQGYINGHPNVQSPDSGDTEAIPRLPLTIGGNESANCIAVLRAPSHYSASEVAYCRSVG